MFLEPQNREKYKAIVIYPQCPVELSFVELTKTKDRQLSRLNDTPKKIGTIYFDMLHELILQMIATGNVDTDRIYIGGRSMGAVTTYEMISQYPDLFAAATPISGATYLQNLDKWKDKVAVWIFHGEVDKAVPVEASRELVKRYKQLGAINFRYTEFPGVGHMCLKTHMVSPTIWNGYFLNQKNIRI